MLDALSVYHTGTADVVEAVKFSSAEGLGVAVKAGGHSAPNYGLIDGGLTIDMSLMRSCTVDPYKKIAVAAGRYSLCWQQLFLPHQTSISSL